MVAAQNDKAKGKADIEPARAVDGSLPGLPPLAVSGGEVMLSVSVTSKGVVDRVDVLRDTPPYTAGVVQAVRSWRFTAALDGDGLPLDTRVLVGAVITAPALHEPTLGTPPTTAVTLDPRVPFPGPIAVPTFPVGAMMGGTVMVESRLDRSGRVSDARVVRSSQPFDALALAAARGTTYRPATAGDVPPAPYVYLIFVFRAPTGGAVVAPSY